MWRTACRCSAFWLIYVLPLSTFAIPQQIDPVGEKIVVVYPDEHQWGAYDTEGNLVRSGIASAGADWCADMGSTCHTEEGTFRIRSLGGSNCKSPSFPIPNGGAPMPYCMYFTPYQALHGYPHVAANENKSHGCVRMSVSDARWLRYYFVQIGTLVRIESY